MAYLSAYGVSPGERFFVERSYYTSGSYYKRAQLTNSQKLNRQAVEGLRDQLLATGSSVFSVSYSQSEQTSLLVARQLQERLQAEASSKVNILV